MTMSYLEELTLKAYEAIGVSTCQVLRPQNFARARGIVRRLLASGLDPDDLIVEGMPEAEVHEIETLTIALVALRRRYTPYAS
jgi:hypothetical protein